MTVADLRRSPLGHRTSIVDGGATRLRATELPFSTQLNVRIHPGSPGLARLERAIGVPFPHKVNLANATDGRAVLALGPDEWLVVAEEGVAMPSITELTRVIGDSDGSAVDVSANRTTVALSGTYALEVLEKGCAVDLHPRVFSPGQCVQTMVARAQVVLWHPAQWEYRLLVRGSFAEYLADWLVDAGAEFVSNAVVDGGRSGRS